MTSGVTFAGISQEESSNEFLNLNQPRFRELPRKTPADGPFVNRLQFLFEY